MNIMTELCRPPNTSISAFTEKLTNSVRTLRIENKQFYITGDFNINILNDDHHMETHDYVDAMFSKIFNTSNYDSNILEEF